MAKKASATEEVAAIANAQPGDVVAVSDPTKSLEEMTAEAIGELNTRISALETKNAALRQAIIDLAALLRNAGPPTKGALECVNNTLARLEPVANG